MTEPRNPAPPDDPAYGVLRIKAGPGGGAQHLAHLVELPGQSAEAVDGFVAALDGEAVAKASPHGAWVEWL